MLTGKYVISPVDGKEYCRKNGQFLRHLKMNGFNSYQQMFDILFPEKIKTCNCGLKCSFDSHKMKYRESCGNRDCVGRVISTTKQGFSEEKWAHQRLQYQSTMSQKPSSELQAIICKRTTTGHTKGSYQASVSKREKTCEERYGRKKYNNHKKISQTKLDWDNSRKQLFLERLTISLKGKKLNDFHTEDMYVARRIMLEQRGDIIPWEQLSEWQQYSKKVRNLTEKNYRKFKKIINPNNLVRSEYELDHIVPIFFGFQNDIPEQLISSVENLQMLKRGQNRSKGKNYDSTVSNKHKELENPNS